MAEQVSWDSIPKDSGGNSGNGGDFADFLRLESGKVYKIRPVFSPVKFYKYFTKTPDNKIRTAICADPSSCSIRDVHPELKKPALRYAAYVIDRADGKVKILEAPQSVFLPIGNNFEITGKNPGGGADGSDWYIKVSGKGLTTKYDVGFIKQSPLTSEEKDAIKKALDGDSKKLQKLFAADTPEAIEEKLFGGSSKKAVEEVEDDDIVEDVVESKAAGDEFDNNW